MDVLLVGVVCGALHSLGSGLTASGWTLDASRILSLHESGRNDAALFHLCSDATRDASSVTGLKFNTNFSAFFVENSTKL